MLVIVDGYNVLRSSSRTARLEGENLRAERRKFIANLRKYQDNRQDKIIVVFDGAQADTGQPVMENLGGVNIIFSGHGQSADEVIKDIVEHNINPENTIVVSSDRDVVSFVRSRGVSVAGARSLADKLQLLETARTLTSEYPVEGSLKEDVSYKRRKGNPRRPKRNRQRLKLW